METSTDFSVTTVNLNGIRAAERRGFLGWLEEKNPDVLLMQEVRAPSDITAKILGENWAVYSHPCEIKGRAGVAIALNRSSQSLVGIDLLTPEALDENLTNTDADSAFPVVRYGLPGDMDPVDSGRWMELDLQVKGESTVKPVTVVSTYFHSGQINTPKQESKMAHLPRIGSRLNQLLSSETAGNMSVVAGDFNVVRSQSDIKNWRGNHNKASGVLDEEMVFLNGWVDEGWSDIVRDLSGDVQGPYTWWSWRGKAFDNDTGWRIDYQYATPQLGQAATGFDIFRADSYDQRFSDHAPLTVRYSL